MDIWTCHYRKSTGVTNSSDGSVPFRYASMHNTKALYLEQLNDDDADIIYVIIYAMTCPNICHIDLPSSLFVCYNLDVDVGCECHFTLVTFFKISLQWSKK